MYRPSPVRNPRAKGIKSKNVIQVCLLLAVCFWLIFQVKRSHDKKKQFDNTNKEFANTKISLSQQSIDEIPKFGRKDLQPKLEKESEIHEEQDEQDEEKIEEGKEDEIDETEQEKSEVEVDQEEIDEESQSQSQSQTEDHEEEEEEEGASTHTHEGREEQYKADDASSAVVTHLSSENSTNEEISNGQIVNNNGPLSSSRIMEGFGPNETEESSNSSYVKSDELNSNEDESEGEGENEGENLEGNNVILDQDEVENERHLEEKEVRMDLDTLPEIETEGGESEDSAEERR